MIKKKVPYTLLTATALATLLSSTAFAAKGDFYYGDASNLTRVQKSEVKDKKDILKANKDKLYYQIDDTNIVKYSDYLLKIVSGWATGSSIGNAVTTANADQTVRAGSDIVEKAAQVDAGLIVSSVSVVNKTTVQVVLKDVPSTAPTADKFVVKVGDSVVPVTKVTAQTGTSTTFTLDVALDGKEGKVNVNGTDSAVFDYKAPEVASITPVTSKIFDVTFSEDVNVGLAQTIGNYAIVETGTANVVNMAGSTVAVKDSKTVRITLPAALTKDKSYTVTVNNMQDVSANKNTMTASSSKSFTAISDTTKPTILSAVGTDANKVEVTMSKEMDANVAITASIKPYNTDGTLGNEILVTTGLNKDYVQVNGNKATIVINSAHSANYLVNGQKYKVTLTAGADLSGNAIADSQSVDVTGVADVIAPTVAGDPTYDSATKKLTIKFSEPMIGSATVANYALFETNTGIPIINAATTGVLDAAPSSDGTSVVLTLGGVVPNKDYSVRIISGLTDASITPNALAQNTVVRFTTPAVVTPVELSSASTAGLTDGKSVKLTFNTNLNKTEAENIANYAITDATDTTKTLAVTAAKYDDSAKTVTLTTAPQEQGTANYKVTVSGLTNLKTDKNTATFDGIDKVAPTLTGITSLNETAVDLVFDQDVAADQSTGVTVAIVEKGTANSITANSLTATSGNKNKVRVTFSGVDAQHKLTAGKTYTFTVTGVKDANGNTSTAGTIDCTSIADTQAPVLTNVVAKNGASIELCFNEEIVANGTLSAANFELKKGDTAQAWDNLKIAINPTDNTKLVLTNTSDGTTPETLFENGADYTITAKDNSTNYLKDLAGNKVTSAAYTFKGVVDTVKPQLSSAVMSATADNKVVLTFSKPIQAIADNATNQADFVVTDANTGVATGVTAVTSGTGDDANKVTLTLASSTQVGKQYKVYISDPSIIKDNEVTPNTLDTDHAVVTFGGVDKTAPTSVVIETLKDANTVSIKFDEKLDPTSVSADDFAVHGNTITAVNVDSTDSSVVTLTLGTAVDTGVQLAIKIVADKSVTDLAGNALIGAASTGTVLTGTYVDAAVPTLVKTQKTSASTITLTFSENLAAITTQTTGITVPGYTVSSIDAVAGQKTVVVTLGSNISAGTNPTVSIAAGQTIIKDLATPTANVYVGGDTVVAQDAIAPAVSGVSLNDGSTVNAVIGTQAGTSSAPKTITFTGLTGTITSGTATLNKDVKVTISGTASGIYDVVAPGVSVKATDNLTSIILSAITDNGVTGISATNFESRLNNAIVTLTDDAGNSTVYKIVVNP